MNKLKYLLSAFVLLCFASCKDDPWEDVADGGWNHERSIIDVKFEGQAGTPSRRPIPKRASSNCNWRRTWSRTCRRSGSKR